MCKKIFDPTSGIFKINFNRTVNKDKTKEKKNKRKEAKEKAKDLYNNYLYAFINNYHYSIERVGEALNNYQSYYNFINNLSKEDIETYDNILYYVYNKSQNNYIKDICASGKEVLTKAEYKKYKYFYNIELISENEYNKLLKFVNKYINKKTKKVIKHKLNKDIKYVNKFANKNLDKYK